MSLSRRDFIKNASTMTTVALSTLFFSWPLSLVGSEKKLKDLRKAELLLLTKLVDIIIPQTENTPSASSLHVPFYIQKVMGGEIPRYRRLRRSSFYRKVYEKLFSRLQSISKKKHQQAFETLSTEEASKILNELATQSTVQVGYRTSGLAKIEKITDSQLFSILRAHTIQGYFADPIHGANRDYKSWEAIGYICHVNYPGDQKTCSAEDHVHNHD